MSFSGRQKAVVLVGGILQYYIPYYQFLVYHEAEETECGQAVSCFSFLPYTGEYSLEVYNDDRHVNTNKDFHQHAIDKLKDYTKVDVMFVGLTDVKETDQLFYFGELPKYPRIGFWDEQEIPEISNEGIMFELYHYPVRSIKNDR